MQRFFPRSRFVWSALVLVVTGAMADKDYKAPQIKAAQTYPAHEQHKDEAVAIAVDPYDTPEKEKIFTVDYREHQLLPILLIISNDGEQPVSLTDMRVQLITVHRDKLMPAGAEEIQRRIAHPERNDRPPLAPFPLPRRGKVKGTLSQKTKDEIQNAQFAAKAVEPHSSRSGFLFFDVEGISSLAGAHILFTGLHNGQGGDLMFFEIPLDKYFGAAGSPSP